MKFAVGDRFKALLHHRDLEDDSEASAPTELYRMQILSIDGESIIYHREGGKPGEVTRTILQAALERGDVVKIAETDSE